MDIIFFLIVLATLSCVIGILLYFFYEDRKQHITLQQEYLKQLKDMTDKIYFRKPEEFTQNKVIDTTPPTPFEKHEEQYVPFEQAPIDEVIKAMGGS